jgi:hypothetical protein
MAWKTKYMGEWPGHWNSLAQLICEQLWRKAGGVPHGGLAARDGSLTAWRKYIVAARRYYPPHPAGKLVEHILAGDPPKRRPQRTDEQSRRWRRAYDHPSRSAFFARKTNVNAII